MKPAALLLAAASALAAPGDAQAALYGLVVGVDQYVGVAPLRGAVNDATDIAGVLRKTGAKRVELMTDAAAQRDSVLGAWRSILDEAATGDTIVFSFAGHGAQEPDDEQTKDEADGLDEVFLLQGFAEADDATFANKLRDDELYQWATDAESRGVKVIFVFDTCYSGVPVRSIDPRAGGGEEAYSGFRFTRYSTRPTEPAKVEDPTLLARLDFGDNITALGATDESLRVREQRVDGKPRGILSWAFARAIEGAADQDDDKAIASDELVSYVKRTVFDQARHRQIPQFFAPNRSVRLLSVVPDGPPPAEDSRRGTEPPRVSLFVPNAPPVGFSADGVDIAASRADADLIWDPVSGDLLDSGGDVLAFALGRDDLDAALKGQRVRRAISGLIAGGRTLDVALLPDNKRHCAGDAVKVEGLSDALTHYTAFNLTGAGEVQFLWPLARFNDPLSLAEGQLWQFETQVSEPYGSDAVVLIASDRPLEKLHTVLEYSSRVLDPIALWKLIEQNLENATYEIAVQDIFTRDRGQGSEPCE